MHPERSRSRIRERDRMMASIKQTIDKLHKRTIPLELLSYIIGRRKIGIDRTAWDREYATGQWDRLGTLAELPRYAIIAGYSRFIGAAASVLDIGCGTGHLLRWLCQDGERHYVGIDISGVAIQQARQCASSQARFEVADAATFDPGDRFDIIVFNEMLYYMERPELVLERFESFLAPGGAFIVSMWRSPESLRTWRRCAARLDVFDQVRLQSANAVEWRIWFCRPKQFPTSSDN